MKKRMIGLLVTIVLSSLILPGCSSTIKNYTDPAQIINTSVNQEFNIALSSNMTTGYSWQPVYDANALTLVSREYKADDTAGKQIVGAGGMEYFRFKAIKSGDTEVSLTYYRPWETPKPDDRTVTFKIQVK